MIFVDCESSAGMLALYLLESSHDFDLSPGQRVQVECAKESRERIESNEIRDFLTTLKPPLFYLDFESIPMAIPPFKGYSPYQHLTFQYSLHIGKEEN